MKGKITDWNDDRGFGFIMPKSDGKRLFFHISELVQGAPRPETGDWVNYVESIGKNGKPCAVKVVPVGYSRIKNKTKSKRMSLSALAITVWLLYLWLVVLKIVPMVLFWMVSGMSILALVFYGMDKWAAKKNTQRTPEITLQLMAVLGGWPGALLAQQLFRHKSKKRSFQWVFWLMVALNCSAMAFLFSPNGEMYMRQLSSLM